MNRTNRKCHLALMPRARLRPAFIGALLGLVLAQGCTGSAGLVRERLDRETGATITTAAAALVFARTDARYSRSGRDYLYVGPVSTNQQGLREFYLWIGLGTTIDRGYLAPERPIPNRLHVVIDDELMEFELHAWPIDGIRRDRPAYATSVPIDTELGARVTLDQISLLADDTIQSVFVSDSAGQQVYSSWGGAEWREFLRRQGATQLARESR